MWVLMEVRRVLCIAEGQASFENPQMKLSDFINRFNATLMYVDVSWLWVNSEILFGFTIDQLECVE